MTEKVAIVGLAQTRCAARKGNSLERMIFETASGALADAGIEREDVDSLVLACHDQIDGRAISSMLTAPPAGAFQKDEVRLAEDGALAVAMAYMRLLSGDFSASLVVSWSKCSEAGPDTLHEVARLNFDPFFYRPFAHNDVTAHAIQAQSYMNKYGVTEAQAAAVVAKNRAQAIHNPKAHLRKEVTVDQVLKSRPLAWPLKELDLPPWSDGACALVLMREERARSIKGPLAWIRGLGWSNDTYYLGDKDLAELHSLKAAAKMAYRMSGIGKPSEEIDVAEVHDITSFHELMVCEGLGFCGPGEGGRSVERGRWGMAGKLPVNPSGGCLSSNPYTATGLVRVAEAALQVMGKAGEHQVPGARTALAHGMGGMCGQNNCVVILGKEAVRA